MHVGVDRRPARIRAGQPSPETRDWLQAECRPLIDAIELSVPEKITVGHSEAVSATGVTSEFGLEFPLRYPATVSWSGGPGLAVVRTESEAKSAGRSPKTLAVLDLASGSLTAVRSGTVTLTVSSGDRTASATVGLV
ncbi:hypothetical protein ACFTY7_02710 [Streptomyces sp. NPDC057062]